MASYYSILEVSPTASVDEIHTAYQRQRERYDLERLADMAPELRQTAEERIELLETAYATLSDPIQRASYDQSLTKPKAPTAQRSKGLSKREILTALGGAVIGLFVIGIVWFLSGQGAEQPLPPVGELNRPAPDFTLPGLDGREVRLQDYRGKVVLINFWGTWCEPCKEETPALQAMYEKLADQGLMIIGVDLRNQERAGDAGIADVQAFIDQYNVTYPIALDVDGEVARAFQIYPIPTTFFIDPSGTIRYVRPSTVTAEEVEILFLKLQQAASALR
jgi:cytochrome c biogenesis protein CcmG/thiol:disulfide interchange protein DsbE